MYTSTCTHTHTWTQVAKLSTHCPVSEADCPLHAVAPTHRLGKYLQIKRRSGSICVETLPACFYVKSRIKLSEYIWHLCLFILWTKLIMWLYAWVFVNKETPSEVTQWCKIKGCCVKGVKSCWQYAPLLLKSSRNQIIFNQNNVFNLTLSVFLYRVHGLIHPLGQDDTYQKIER